MTSHFRVVYTDPEWAIGPAGEIDTARSTIERGIFNDRINFQLGVRAADAFVRSGPALLQAVRGANALVIYRTEVTPELVEALQPSCRVVARQGVGFDNLNATLLAQAGIWAFNVPDYCVDEVTAHTMALVLALERKVITHDRLVKSDKWSILAAGYPRRLVDLTFGIIGFGRIGRATSRKALAFYKSVVAYDPYVHEDLMRGYGVAKAHRLDDFLRACDVVALHCALTPETSNIINRQSIREIRPGALLINTARGRLVEPEAVSTAIREGRLGGYASDVFAPEDPNRDPINRELLRLDNVVVTAHCAFLSSESERSVRVRVAEEVMHVLMTETPPRFGRLA